MHVGVVPTVSQSVAILWDFVIFLAILWDFAISIAISLKFAILCNAIETPFGDTYDIIVNI